MPVLTPATDRDLAARALAELARTTLDDHWAVAAIPSERRALLLERADAAALRPGDGLGEPIADGLRLTATVEIAAQSGEEAVVMEPADRSIWVGEAVTSRQGGTLTSVAEMVAVTGAPFALDRSGLRLTVLGGGRAVQIEGCPAP